MKYNINAYMDKIYSTFPEGDNQPTIGIVTNFTNVDATIREVYYNQVINSGGTPILIPPITDSKVIVNILDKIDGLILTGGADVNPLWVGEEPVKDLGYINDKRDLSDLLITKLAFNRQIPILAICRGIQVLVMALGGKNQQHIYDPYIKTEEIEKKITGIKKITTLQPAKIKHSQDAEKNVATHSIKVKEGSILYSIYKEGKIYVNSFHHQAVNNPGKRFKVTGIAADGVIECIESNELKPILGVQWHPEWMKEEGLKLFKWLTQEANNFKNAKQLHKNILTLDTHCDTPMFFPQGVDFSKRDPRILYDIHKMTEGRQDAVTMAAYLPQPSIGETFSSKINIEGLKQFNPDLNEILNNLTPFSYTNFIFDKIENIVKQNYKYLSIARTPYDLYEDKRKGRKSIMFAIENGLAIENNLENIKHFALRGVIYITLCHNGDNNICDSARGCNTHNGVSQFGEKVIEEMNKSGIMVDLSHGGEKSFYDALEISKVPIVCSHSNSKALCDVPRNLTDEQMRALAKKGGVAHTTLYTGFLNKNSYSTILDVIAHLEHAIKIMGIEHVGIGTDFDGDGTVTGMADASEMINLTKHLLKRKYNEKDIEKIWGGNWLRVMTEVQSASKKTN